MRRRLHILFAVFAAAFAAAQLLPATSSSFTDTTANSGNTATAAADWTAPSITASVVQKAEGGVVNKIQPSGTFYVYANVTDSGNPAAGVGTVTATVSNIATASSATLSAGSWTVGGTTYNYRSALLTAKSTLTTTTYSYSLSVSDQASNGPTTSSPTLSASNATFVPSSFLTSNKTGGTAGKTEAGDTITFTYNNAPDPEAVFAGWDGTSRTVTVKLADKSVYATTSDIIGIVDSSGNTTPLGYVLTGGSYAGSGRVVNFTNSTIVLSGSTFTVTLGTPDVSSYLTTDSNSRTAQWLNYTTMFNEFGTASSGATITGASRKQF